MPLWYAAQLSILTVLCAALLFRFCGKGLFLTAARWLLVPLALLVGSANLIEGMRELLLPFIPLIEECWKAFVLRRTKSEGASAIILLGWYAVFEQVVSHLPALFAGGLWGSLSDSDLACSLYFVPYFFIPILIHLCTGVLYRSVASLPAWRTVVLVLLGALFHYLVNYVSVSSLREVCVPEWNRVWVPYLTMSLFALAFAWIGGSKAQAPQAH